ncbi:FHA domain-containing protein [Alteromonadaceae bacterium BrNp21-10]|nr:FHA domain-containing protein [Alteromonadaceae bacterium BrNp21-10]
MNHLKTKLTRFYGELRRRNVLNTIALYIVSCWIILQVGSVTFPIFDVKNDYYHWMLAIFIMLFPVAICISWFYNLTVHGFVRIAPFSERRMLNNMSPIIDRRMSLNQSRENIIRADGWYLLAETGPVEGLEYNVTDGITFGRAIECDITLLRSYISRFHAKFSIQDNNLYIEDLKSANGTVVNNEKIVKPRRLHNGDEIRFKDIVFKINEYSTQNQGDSMLDQTTLINNG